MTASHIDGEAIPTRHVYSIWQTAQGLDNASFVILLPWSSVTNIIYNIYIYIYISIYPYIYTYIYLYIYLYIYIPIYMYILILIAY